MLYRGLVVDADLDVRVTDVDAEPPEGLQSLMAGTLQAIACTAAAYCFSKAAIMKGSPYTSSVTTVTSLSVRVSMNASEVGVRMRRRRIRAPDGTRPRPISVMSVHRLAKPMKSTMASNMLVIIAAAMPR